MRNYYHGDTEKMYGSKMTFFPLGWQDGFAKGEVKKPSERKYNWAFVGDLGKSIRAHMYQGMEQIPKGCTFYCLIKTLGLIIPPPF